MPRLDDQIEDMDPSTMSELDDTAHASGTEQQPDPAASSPATGENEDAELLSVVRDVVKESRSPSNSASPAEGEEGNADQQGQAKKPDNEEFTDVPFHNHPRFKHLVRERNSLRTDAGRYQNVVGFIENAGLTAEEAANGLSIMGLAKTNPAEAFRQLRPWLEQLVVAAGEVLPDDLKQRVAKGELTSDAALEVSRARATAQSVQASQSFREQREQRQREHNDVKDIRTAAQAWEDDRTLRDPNFAAKRPQLEREILYLQRTEGMPRTAAEVTAQLHKAYKAVNDAIRPQPVPRQQQQQRRPSAASSSTGHVAGKQQPAEMSTIDIVRANRRAS